MSARKIDLSSISNINHAQRRLSLAGHAVRLRQSGIEFKTADPIPAWTEMSVDLQYPDAKKVHCTGVVVACDGNRHAGYIVSLLFTKLSRQSQALISALSYA
ncbi:MAG: PilZ domain-containing protein [Verrucomicrobiota bacterium]